MDPVSLLKHASLDAFDDWLKKWSPWKLWAALFVLAGVDMATAMLDFIPLIDDMIVGGLAIRISAELYRRRRAAVGQAEKSEGGAA
jgi:hypothetical protein